MARVDDYTEASRVFLDQAKEELARDDLVQASEKILGAAAQIVKAVAESRDWRHDSHRALFQVVNRLAQETGDETLRDAFSIAQALPYNFYERVGPREFVERGLTLTEEFVRKVERLA